MTGISFALLGGFILLEFFWEQQVVPEAVFYLSPFAQVYPINPITFWPVMGLILVSVLLAVLGGVAFRSRDLSSN